MNSLQVAILRNNVNGVTELLRDGTIQWIDNKSQLFTQLFKMSRSREVQIVIKTYVDCYNLITNAVRDENRKELYKIQDHLFFLSVLNRVYYDHNEENRPYIHFSPQQRMP